MVGEAELTTPSMGGAVEGGGLGTTINGAEVPGLDVPPVTETSSLDVASAGIVENLEPRLEQPDLGPALEDLAKAPEPPTAESNGTPRTYDVEGKRFASEIQQARVENQARGSTEKPDVEVAYDLAMKINLLRAMKAKRLEGGSFNDSRLEQNRLQEIEGLKKAEVDTLAEYFTLAAERGEDFHVVSEQMINDIGEVGTRTNLFRVDERVRTELSTPTQAPSPKTA